MKTNWIYTEPIDFEHKQYVLLDYYQKLEKEFDDLKLYPSFQDITLHLANINLAQSKLQYLTTKNPITQPDEEILISEIKYHSPKIKNEDDIEVINEVVKYSREKFTQLFMVGKSLWEIVNESISLKLVKNYEQLMTGNGYFKFVLNDTLYIYEFKIKGGELHTQKCYINEIYKGKVQGSYQLMVDNTSFTNPDITKEDLVKLLPLFEITIDPRFPLEETTLPLIKRKITNYVMQTVKINEIKEINKDGN
jgi:hypothetical protein